jgi:hypothetical protein
MAGAVLIAVLLAQAPSTYDAVTDMRREAGTCAVRRVPLVGPRQTIGDAPLSRSIDSAVRCQRGVVRNRNAAILAERRVLQSVSAVFIGRHVRTHVDEMKATTGACIALDESHTTAPATGFPSGVVTVPVTTFGCETG